jgi:hypothetical protein
LHIEAGLQRTDEEVRVEIGLPMKSAADWEQLRTDGRKRSSMAGMRLVCCFVFALLVGLPCHAQAGKALLLFGGKDHKTFLGCLNCSPKSEGSVCNKFGVGSKFDTNSIWNKFGDFGSKFSEYSPWNKFSTSAPIIVDKDGGSYGYFSANKFHTDRTKIKWFVRILDFQADHDDLEATRDLMCTE